MRTHRKLPGLALWRDAALLREVAQLRHLASARVEPLLQGGALLDLVFCAGDRVAVIPCLEIGVDMLLQREMSPLVWPHEAAMTIGDDATDPLERAVLPWIESLCLGRQLNVEVSRAFGDRESAGLVAAAREAGLLGAAPYSRVFEDIAPYYYACRFSENGRVAIHDARGACGAALLARHARAIYADFEDEQRQALAERWFGRTFASVPDGTFDVAVYRHGAHPLEADVRIVLDAPSGEGEYVQVAMPFPCDVTISFDAHDVPACRAFAVHNSAKESLRPGHVPVQPAASGGSAGRILFVMREDYLRAPDADTDEANALAMLLRAEGFSVDISGASAARPEDYDLVHAFTLARVDRLTPALSAARSAGKPIVISPFFQDLSAQAAWGTAIVRMLIQVSLDEVDIEDNLVLLGRRRLEMPGLSAARQEPFPGYGAAVRQALDAAGALMVSSAEEEALVRGFGYGGPAIQSGPCLFAADSDSPRGVPWRGGYVLAHGPVEARSNLLLLVRAAVAARVPLVVAGPLTESGYVAAVRERADERVVFLPEPGPGQVEELYRGARVFADVGWVRYGPHRLVRAAASGAALVATPDAHLRALLGADGVWEADPASQAAIATALSDAWMHAGEQPKIIEVAARRAAAAGDPRTALVAAVRAYAAAQQSRAPA